MEEVEIIEIGPHQPLPENEPTLVLVHVTDDVIGSEGDVIRHSMGYTFKTRPEEPTLSLNIEHAAEQARSLGLKKIYLQRDHANA